jgi:A/G-specific adenine glycosylase
MATRKRLRNMSDDEAYTPSRRALSKACSKVSKEIKPTKIRDDARGSQRAEQPAASPKRLHPRGLHSLTSPETMREDLLEWYSDVHEIRGMPWRKPFDPSLDADGRAQRAYEVFDFTLSTYNHELTNGPA